MHAVVVRVTVNDVEASIKELRESVVPTVSQAPGFVAGYWLAPPTGRDGLSFLIYEDEPSARAMAGVMHSRPQAALLSALREELGPYNRTQEGSDIPYPFSNVAVPES